MGLKGIGHALACISYPWWPVRPRAEKQLSIRAPVDFLELTPKERQPNVEWRQESCLSRPSVGTITQNPLRVCRAWFRDDFPCPHSNLLEWPSARVLLIWLLLATLFIVPVCAQSQSDEEVKPVPLLTGSGGFITTFDGGEPHLHPIVTPLVLVPIGQRWLFETRATFETDMVQLPGRSGFHGGAVQKEVEYVQLDFVANPYVTVTVGRFLTPFGIFNERLYPVWIRNLQSDPLILPIGIGPSNASTGGMLRGGFQVHPQINLNYAVYFSALSTASHLDSDRFSGGRAGVFVPRARLEFGGSFQHLLQEERSNSFGFHLIWQPPALPLDIRGEYAHSKVGSGYWLESAYRLSQLPFLQNEKRRTQFVARYQQFFLGSLPSDALPPVNTKQFESGLNYYFMDGLKASSSYGRQFSAEGNKNVWTIGLTYRFVIPLGRAGGE
jgi:hypothetical protein